MRIATQILAAFLSGLVVIFAGCQMVPPEKSKEIIEYRQLCNSDPRRIAALLREFYPVITDTDDRTGIVIVKGSVDSVAAALSMMNRLESVADGGDLPWQRFFLKNLHNAKAKDVAAILESLAQKGVFSADCRPSYYHTQTPVLAVAYDERINAVLVNVDVIYEERIRNIIDELDRPLQPSTQPQPEIRLERGNLVPASNP
jgi:hypothetical protein